VVLAGEGVVFERGLRRLDLVGVETVGTRPLSVLLSVGLPLGIALLTLLAVLTVLAILGEGVLGLGLDTVLGLGDGVALGDPVVVAVRGRGDGEAAVRAGEDIEPLDPEVDSVPLVGVLALGLGIVLVLLGDGLTLLPDKEPALLISLLPLLVTLPLLVLRWGVPRVVLDIEPRLEFLLRLVSRYSELGLDTREVLLPDLFFNPNAAHE